MRPPGKDVKWAGGHQIGRQIHSPRIFMLPLPPRGFIANQSRLTNGNAGDRIRTCTDTLGLGAACQGCCPVAPKATAYANSATPA